MTPQEQEMIDGLISRIRGTEVQDKDTAAEQHLQQGLAGYPDSLYVLAQTVLVQQYGLQQAQAQMEELKQQNATLQEAAHQAKSSGGGGSFLSHIFGSGSTPPASQPVQAPSYQPVNNAGSAQQPYPGGGYPPPPGYPSPAYPPQSYPPQSYPPQGYPAPARGGLFGGGGGFLQGAMQTAAGVAAGEIAFQGMEDLFHGFGGGGGESRGFGGSGGGETVVNNYYDDGRGQDDRGDGGRDSGNFYNPSDDASRGGGGDSAQFADTGNDDSGNDNAGFDDNSNFDDSGNDSGGSGDMSGNF